MRRPPAVVEEHHDVASINNELLSLIRYVQMTLDKDQFDKSKVDHTSRAIFDFFDDFITQRLLTTLNKPFTSSDQINGLFDGLIKSFHQTCKIKGYVGNGYLEQYESVCDGLGLILNLYHLKAMERFLVVHVEHVAEKKPDLRERFLQLSHDVHHYNERIQEAERQIMNNHESVDARFMQLLTASVKQNAELFTKTRDDLEVRLRVLSQELRNESNKCRVSREQQRDERVKLFNEKLKIRLNLDPYYVDEFRNHKNYQNCYQLYRRAFVVKNRSDFLKIEKMLAAVQPLCARTDDFAVSLQKFYRRTPYVPVSYYQSLVAGIYQLTLRLFSEFRARATILKLPADYHAEHEYIIKDDPGIKKIIEDDFFRQGHEFLRTLMTRSVISVKETRDQTDALCRKEIEDAIALLKPPEEIPAIRPVQLIELHQKMLENQRKSRSFVELLSPKPAAIPTFVPVVEMPDTKPLPLPKKSVHWRERPSVKALGVGILALLACAAVITVWGLVVALSIEGILLLSIVAAGASTSIGVGYYCGQQCCCPTRDLDSPVLARFPSARPMQISTVNECNHKDIKNQHTVNDQKNNTSYPRLFSPKTNETSVSPTITAPLSPKLGR